MNLSTEQEIQTFKKGSLKMETEKEGQKLKYSCYRFVVEINFQFPYEELTDKEILTLVEKAGTYDFLKEQEEDIYSTSDGTPI